VRRYVLQHWDWHAKEWIDSKKFFFKYSAANEAIKRSLKSRWSDRWQVISVKSGPIFECRGPREVSEWSIDRAVKEAEEWEARYQKLFKELLAFKQESALRLKQYRDTIKILALEFSKDK